MTGPLGPIRDGMADRIGRRVFDARARAGLSQAALGKEAGIAQSQISAYERGQLRPSLRAAILVADALDVSLDYLVGRSNEWRRVP